MDTYPFDERIGEPSVLRRPRLATVHRTEDPTVHGGQPDINGIGACARERDGGYGRGRKPRRYIVPVPTAGGALEEPVHGPGEDRVGVARRDSDALDVAVRNILGVIGPVDVVMKGRGPVDPATRGSDVGRVGVGLVYGGTRDNEIIEAAVRLLPGHPGIAAYKDTGISCAGEDVVRIK